MELSLRREILATARAMNEQGLNQGTAGNISVRYGDGFLITPSGLPYSECHPGDVVAMDFSGQARGPGKPSTEWRLHRDIYVTKPEAHAILHAHSPWCTTLACLEREIPPFHYMVAVAGGDTIPCVPYALFGSQELSDLVLAGLQQRRACLMAHHGMVCHAAGLKAVLALAMEVENLARVYGQALRIGTPALLTREEMSEVQKRFASYYRKNE